MITTSQASASREDRRDRWRRARSAVAWIRVHVPHERRPRRARRASGPSRPPLTPQPTTATEARSPASVSSGDHAAAARSQRGHRARVEHRLERPRVRVREQHEPGHGREAARRVARERRHPLEQGVAAAERRHRAEVAGRVVRHVDLRLHRPLAAVVRDERLADGVVRLGIQARHGGARRPPRARRRERIDLVEALSAGVPLRALGVVLVSVEVRVRCSGRILAGRELGAVDERRRVPEPAAEERLGAVREDLVDLDQEAELRDLPLDGAGREQVLVGDERARPFTRSVSPTPGTRNSRPTWGSAGRCGASRRAVPGRSGSSSVRSSRTRTKPAGSPRGLTSQVPSGAEVARQTKGERRRTGG